MSGVASANSPRWVPVAAAVLAVLSAVGGYLSSQRQSQALIVKDEAVIAVTRAADAWNRFESDRIQATVYQAAIDAGTAKDPARLRTTARSMDRQARTEYASSETWEHEVTLADTKSEHLSHQHDTIEIGTTLFEVAIVLVSIAALVGSRVLPIATGCFAVLGLIVALLGALS
jgi:hypothetical protein